MQFPASPAPVQRLMFTAIPAPAPQLTANYALMQRLKFAATTALTCPFAELNSHHRTDWSSRRSL